MARVSINHRFPLSRIKDVAITLVLWSYFTLGFILFFSPFYGMAFALARDRETALQRLNHRFYRGFLGLVRFLIPGHTWRIDPEAARLHSCVVVCNHRSYLDPLVMISLFPRHKTIVKAGFFDVPIFGRFLEASGYIPSAAGGRFSTLMVRHMAAMKPFLENQGILFIFPEGTRNREGGIYRLNKGAFKIARICRAPIAVLGIRNTDRLFTPGKFAFNTSSRSEIRVDLLTVLNPDYSRETFSLTGLMDQVTAILETELQP